MSFTITKNWLKNLQNIHYFCLNLHYQQASLSSVSLCDWISEQYFLKYFFTVLFKDFLLLKGLPKSICQTPPNNKEFMQRRRLQQLLTSNTSSCKCYSRCFIMNSVLAGKKHFFFFLKRERITHFFSPAFTLLISSLSLALLNLLLHNLPFLLKDMLTLFVNVNMKVNVFVQKNIYHIVNYE